MGFSGPIGLNHLAIDAAMERMGVKDRLGCFGKITQGSAERQSLEDWWIERMNGDKE